MARVINEDSMADVLEAFADAAEAFGRLATSVKTLLGESVVEEWIDLKTACAVAGVDERRLRYLASDEKKEIRTLKTAPERGKLYQRFDCERISKIERRRA